MQAETQPQFGIVIAGHGSRDADGIREFEQLVELVKERAPQHTVSHGYLEFADPTIDQAIAESSSTPTPSKSSWCPASCWRRPTPKTTCPANC